MSLQPLWTVHDNGWSSSYWWNSNMRYNGFLWSFRTIKHFAILNRVEQWLKHQSCHNSFIHSFWTIPIFEWEKKGQKHTLLVVILIRWNTLAGLRIWVATLAAALDSFAWLIADANSSRLSVTFDRSWIMPNKATAFLTTVPEINYKMKYAY